MRDVSLHIMDIVQNSTRALATLIEIILSEDGSNEFKLEVIDNGCGMSKEMVNNVTDPFCTSRTTRKVGMGIPLLLMNAQQTGGKLTIKSEVGKGTHLSALFQKEHWDMPPLGDLSTVIALIITGNPEHEFRFVYYYKNREFVLDSREVKKILEGVSISSPQVTNFLKEMITENLVEIGVDLK